MYIGQRRDLTVDERGLDGVLDAAELAEFIRRHERDRLALATGTASAADTVDVTFLIERDVVIKDVGDITDIQATRSHVGGD